jgi:type IV pilus assembly protein PilW
VPRTHLPTWGHSRSEPHRARGVSLVELMVALTISMVLVLAATTIHLQTTSTQRAIDQASDAQDAASVTLRILGRELMNAGFYPSVRTESVAGQNVVQGYWNPLNPTPDPAAPAAYDYGVFGCDGGAFDPATRTCPAANATAPDALVVSYFVNDAFGTTIGQRGDCTGTDVAGASVNSGRAAAGTSVPPTLPLFVANHYQLATTSSTINGVTYSSKSLVCNGIGAGGSTFVPLVTGLDDLQVSYGVYTDDSLVPQRFYRANEIAGLAQLQIGEETSPVSAWGHISQVRVCVVARTLMGNVANAGNSDPITYTNCAGTLVTQAAGDRTLRKTMVQIFGLRNRQVFTY